MTEEQIKTKAKEQFPNDEFKQQIEKMKCCSNCTHNYDDCEMLPCRNKNHWKLKE